MPNLKNLFLPVFLLVFYTAQSNCCEVIINDFVNEIKTCEGEDKIKELNGCCYVDLSLLSLQEDGIHLIYGEKDTLVPFMYHDTKGYFLSPQACLNLGTEWICCQCSRHNPILRQNCKTCLKKRCDL